MVNEALLLTSPNSSAEDARVAKVLGFFGVPNRTALPEAWFDATASAESSSKQRLICSVDAFATVVDRLQQDEAGIQTWKARVHSVFVWVGGSSETLPPLLSRLTSCREAFIRKSEPGTTYWQVTSELPDFCRVMSGVRLTATPAHTGPAQVLDTSKGSATSIISSDSGATFVKLDFHGVPVFVSCGSVIDLETTITNGNFDVRDHITSAIPLVLYVKWAFAETCWNAPEINACLVIDDPLLKPQYGFVNFQDLLSLMGHHNFSTSIAFIPWNWRRSAPKVVRLFKEHADRYSLSVHGCDHTAAEFGTQDVGVLATKARQAVNRMGYHQSRTGIRHDPVMVFPQGVFSAAAMSVLKRSTFTAAVNTEVISHEPPASPIRVSDFWNVALMNYAGFPIFTRRYPQQGVENFAFDILLGKPCLIVIHHDFCRDQFRHLVRFINGLNHLKSPISWRSLGEVVKRSCRQRELVSGRVEVEMYGTELRIENRSAQPKRFVIRRSESDPSAIQDVRAESRSVQWTFSDSHIQIEMELDPGESTTISLKFHPFPDAARVTEKFGYKLKTMLRRYLCEVRDNYVVRKPAFISRLRA
jgi:hypothetical protein